MSIEISTPADIVSTLEELNPEALMYDGFDEALVGIIARCSTEPLALYDRAKCIQLLVDKGLTWEQAEEYFCYNVEGCWAGPHTPFIASFNLDPVGIRFPVEDFDPIENKEGAAEFFIGKYVTPEAGSEE
tara:strand:- start:118 stop:507 length:390 start_codon:yes stop_codon:yes gene_type:complete